MPAGRLAARTRAFVAAAACASALGLPGGALRGGAACAAAAGASEVRVAVVVDFGDDPGAPSGPLTTCVPVADGATGAAVLQARAHLLGSPPPRYDDSGLLCSIDGYPDTGCGRRTVAGYLYWSYWHGDRSSWTYANDGPATHRLGQGDVEGWRFQNGTGQAGDNPPRVTPSFDRLCLAAVATTIESPPATPAPPPSTVTTPVVATSVPSATGSALTTTPTSRSPSSSPSTTVGLAAAPTAGRVRAPHRAGTPVGLVVGIALVVTLGGAAVHRVRKGASS